MMSLELKRSGEKGEGEDGVTIFSNSILCPKRKSSLRIRKPPRASALTAMQ